MLCFICLIWSRIHLCFLEITRTMLIAFLWRCFLVYRSSFSRSKMHLRFLHRRVLNTLLYVDMLMLFPFHSSVGSQVLHGTLEIPNISRILQFQETNLSLELATVDEDDDVDDQAFLAVLLLLLFFFFRYSHLFSKITYVDLPFVRV